MIKSSKNQLGNARNPYQGSATRVLCVCSAGMLRSPSMAKVLWRDFAHNTRSCGVDTEFALIPISEALVAWADEIVFAEQVHMDKLLSCTEIPDDVDCYVLNIPDDYDYMADGLEELISEAYIKADKC